MGGTSMQLVEVNQNTLVQWHNNRQKSRNCLCYSRVFSCLSPSLKRRSLFRLQNNYELNHNNQENCTSMCCQRAQRVRRSRGLLSQRHPHRPGAGYTHTTWSITADGTQYT
ncbi:hypothetical protein QQF64_034361 [Cirrhinus molitorella]|uniref:Uncharacterized protein n=1 Tax=Cirrhinus molitorella TaxID=172907 RepID=A0ABR3L1E4_9TELE